MNIIDSIKHTFKQGNALSRLIIINLAVFVLLKLVIIFLTLFNNSSEYILSFLAAPAYVPLLLNRVWTPITYMFLHEGFMHILFNMLNLFWFGKLFTMYFSEKQLVGLYLLGGLFGAAFYIVAFNLFPYYAPLLHQSLLLGASASIMAIIVATAVRTPNMEMQLLFLGSIKLKYIATVIVLMSFFGLTSDNGGGQLAHLGGALAGYLFVVSLQQGVDLTKGLNWLLDAVYDLFRPRKLKIKPNKTRKTGPMSDAEYNANKARKMAQIDHILDKIKTSGYESLNAEEKKQLFDQGKKN